MQLITLIYFLAAMVAAGDAPPPAAKKVTFAGDVRPILERRCQPCHFTGGRMHASLPFDRAETITNLGRSCSPASKRKRSSR